MDNIKAISMIAGSAILASSAFLLYQNTKEDYESKRTKLLEILGDLKAAYIPIYVRSYNIYINAIRELKDKKDSKEFVQQQIQEQSNLPSFTPIVDDQTYKVDQEICETHGLTIDELGEMLTICDKEPEIKEMQDLIDENTTRIFEGKRPDFKLEYPDKITSELYFEILTTIFEFVRYETYTRLRYKIRENSGRTPSKDDIKKLLRCIDIELLRRKVIDHYDIEIDKEKTVEEVLQNVYYTFLSEEGFDEQATEIYKHHEELLVKIISGELLPKLDIDPLTGEKRDYSDNDFIDSIDKEVVAGE